MKKLLMVLTVVCAAGPAFALTQMGPPVATLEQGKFAAGLGFSKSEVDIEAEALGIKALIKDQGMSMYLVNLVFGLDENWELQIDLGVSDTDFETGSSQTDFTGGFVLRTTFGKTDNVKWGIASSVHWYRLQGSGVVYGMDWTEEQTWSEIQFAVGPSYTKDRWCLYGGPFLHFINGEFDSSVNGSDISGDFEEDSMFGGFAGARIEFAKNMEFGIEYQRTGSADAIGACILWRF